jgi:hypothetical protein
MQRRQLFLLRLPKLSEMMLRPCLLLEFPLLLLSLSKGVHAVLYGVSLLVVLVLDDSLEDALEVEVLHGVLSRLSVGPESLLELLVLRLLLRLELGLDLFTAFIVLVEALLPLDVEVIELSGVSALDVGFLTSAYLFSLSDLQLPLLLFL